MSVVSGSAIIVAGETSVTVPYTLSPQPLFNQIYVTPSDDLAGRTFSLNPDTFTAASFEIDIDSIDMADHGFNWQIFVPTYVPFVPSSSYAGISDVLGYSQIKGADFGFTSDSDPNFTAFLVGILAQASAVIDDYCRVPRGFFAAGGMSFTEVINVAYSLHPGYYLATPTYYPYPYLLTSQLNNYPVLSVQHVYVNQAGYGVADAWSDTPGEDDAGVPFPSGYSGWSPKCNVELLIGRIKFVNAVPARYYQGVKATYTAGYAATPQGVNFVCLQLASSVLQVLLQRKLSPIVKVGEWTVKLVITDVFTQEHKRMLGQYQRSLMTT